MNIAEIAQRIRKQHVHYIFGRFRTVRVAYGGVMRVLEGRPSAYDYPRDEASTLFPGADVDKVVQAIRDEAVYVGLKLPPHIVSEILEFARTEPLHAIYDPNGPTFHYEDVTNGVARDGRKMPIGGVRDPARCPAVQKVINDPVLRAIVSRYVNHTPSTVRTILDWSFGSQMTDEERRKLKHHVIDYHYDVGGYNFVYASFYITDCDRYSGAHVMMRRSHNKKPLRMLLGSAVASEAAVREQFGVENEITIEGSAGTGFVQDTSCYHRASPPTRGDRLMLAVRFIN